MESDQVIMAEKNLSNEVTLIVLKILLEFVNDHRKELNQPKSSESNGIADRVFRVLIDALRSPSHTCYSIVLYTAHVIISEFSAAIFRFRNTYCVELVSNVLKACNSKSAKTRSEAASLLILMIENNFHEISLNSPNKVGHIARLKLHLATAVSRMFKPDLPTPSEKDFAKLKEVLAAIAIHSKGKMTELNADKIPYGIEVSELVTRLFSLIDINIQMERSFDPDTKAELYYKLSLSYVDSPDLRLTQLDKLFLLHSRNGNEETSATVLILMAALTRLYMQLLNRNAEYFPSTKEYSRLFPSIASELIIPKATELESVKDEICQSREFSEDGFIAFLSSAILHLQKAKLFESCVEVYNLMLPIYRYKRDYKKQAEIYSELNKLCTSVVSETESGRIFGLYYRVVFYGNSEELKDVRKTEFIYKAKPGLRIAEFKDLLKETYEKKLGTGKVQFLSNLNAVDQSTLENDCAYLQVMAIDTFFTEEEQILRRSQYEHNFDVNKFIFETPFTKEGGKAYTEDVSKQWKRKTTLEMKHSFPFITNRLRVEKKNEVELSPLENSTELILNKVQCLKNELVPSIINKKTLGILLHGILLTQVNAGPLAVALTFLTDEAKSEQPPEHTQQLEKTFVDLVQLLSDALGRQKPLIDTHELVIQTELERSYFEFKSRICQLTRTEPDHYTEIFSLPEPLPSFVPATPNPLSPPKKPLKQKTPGKKDKDKEKDREKDKDKEKGKGKEKETIRKNTVTAVSPRPRNESAFQTNKV
uniref:DOCKER domain-containing protein n=1 Tax=Arcella intermedia TaxID=1963864 RepID=A0A6B2KYP6_9EUKA